jgi:NAD(P)-dependent dehydrogenase (short-subunit alcohol dehydrogenase family)
MIAAAASIKSVLKGGTGGHLAQAGCGGAMAKLKGQVAVVTGAGRGIGRAIAQAYAREEAHVALLARSADQLENAAEEIRAAGGGALPVPADITDRDSLAAALRRVEEQLGPVDVLVNNAGSFYAIGPLWEVDPEKWWTDVTINLRGVFLCCQAVLPGMIVRNRGRILNMIGGGTGNPFPHGSGYASSKAAVMRLTECLVEELRQAGSAVTAFAMGPGLVRTALTEYQLESPEGQKWMSRIQTMFEESRDVPPTRAADLAVALASGRFDGLAGRCFGAGDDLEEVLRRQDEILKKDQKTLRFR